MPRSALVGLLTLIGALPCLAADEDKWSTVKGKVVFVDSKTKRVRDAVVWLAPEPSADEWKRLRLPNTDKNRLREFPSFKPDVIHPDLRAAPKDPAVIDQPCCRFIPHQSAMRVGQTLV